MRLAALAVSFVLLSSPTLLPAAGLTPSYPLITVVFTAWLVAIVLTWRGSGIVPATVARPDAWVTAAVLVAALGLLLAGTHRLVAEMLWHPIDAMHGDMLVVVREGIRRLLHGRNPYTIYHVPWDAPLPYGPILWAPFVVPFWLRIDLRLVTVMGQLVVPAWCAIAAVVEARRGRGPRAVLWGVLLGAIVLNPDLARFTPVGHTPSYWPLLPCFALLVVGQHWIPAAFLLGLLVVGRSTMIALAPVLMMTVWLRARERAASALVTWLATVGALLGPFALWDFGALWYGMVASYQHVMKDIVWTSTDGGVQHTIGLTGWLLSRHLPALVEPAQVCGLLVVYAGAWRALRRGTPALPWMALALMTFSLTALWPVYYIHFDVLLLMVSAAVAEALPIHRPRAAAARSLMLVAGTTAVAGVLMRIAAPAAALVEVGTANGRRAMVSGFAEVEDDGHRRFAWIDGTTARVVLPRASTTAGDIVVTGEPFVPPGARSRRVTALLNGTLLGTVDANAGWQAIRFRSPAKAWWAGANELTLECDPGPSPREIGLSDDPRHLTFAVSRIEVASTSPSP